MAGPLRHRPRMAPGCVPPHSTRHADSPRSRAKIDTALLLLVSRQRRAWPCKPSIPRERASVGRGSHSGRMQPSRTNLTVASGVPEQWSTACWWLQDLGSHRFRATGSSSVFAPCSQVCIQLAGAALEGRHGFAFESACCRSFWFRPRRCSGLDASQCQSASGAAHPHHCGRLIVSGV
jgi:hypothetical protein